MMMKNIDPCDAINYYKHVDKMLKNGSQGIRVEYHLILTTPFSKYINMNILSPKKVDKIEQKSRKQIFIFIKFFVI